MVPAQALYSRFDSAVRLLPVAGSSQQQGRGCRRLAAGSARARTAAAAGVCTRLHARRDGVGGAAAVVALRAARRAALTCQANDLR